MIGEIFADMIGGTSTGKEPIPVTREEFPFNLAVAAHKLRTEVYFMDASVMTRWEASS